MAGFRIYPSSPERKARPIKLASALLDCTAKTMRTRSAPMYGPLRHTDYRPVRLVRGHYFVRVWSPSRLRWKALIRSTAVATQIGNFRRLVAVASLLTMSVACSKPPASTPNAAADTGRLVTPEELKAIPARPPDRRIAYGTDSSQ
jgi:hypothetical protein